MTNPKKTATVLQSGEVNHQPEREQCLLKHSRGVSYAGSVMVPETSKLPRGKVKISGVL